MIESSEEKSKRLRNGRIVGFLAVAWWVASVGGIIMVINLNA